MSFLSRMRRFATRPDSVRFRLESLEGRQLLHGEWNNLDVSNDGVVSPLDALIIINELNASEHSETVGRDGTPSEDHSASAPFFDSDNPVNPLDVSNDGVVSSLDALIIINELSASEHSEAVDADGALPEDDSDSGSFFDSDGDGAISEADVVAEIEGSSDTGLGPSPPAALPAGHGKLETLERLVNEPRTGLKWGAYQMWQDKLWGVPPSATALWNYTEVNGQGKFANGARLPANHHFLSAAFTDDGFGVFVYAVETIPEGSRGVILHSPDGFADFVPELTVDSHFKGVATAPGMRQGLAYLGGGRVMFAEYSDEARMYYRDPTSSQWRLLIAPARFAVDHLHGVFYDTQYQTIYFMSGDNFTHPSVMFANDLFGEHGLVNEPDLWKQRWGLTDSSRSTLDVNYLLTYDNPATVKVEHDCCNQRFRTVNMHVFGDYLFYGEDTINSAGHNIYRVNRQTQHVERVGHPVTGVPWDWLTTEQGELITITASESTNGVYNAGSDGFYHIYRLDEAKQDWVELAKIARNDTPPPVGYSSARTYSFTEAYGRFWVSAKSVGNRDLVLERVSADFNADQVLTATDLDQLSAAIRTQSYVDVFDLDLDQVLDDRDRLSWIHDFKDTVVGDSNLDFSFDSEDLIKVFERGEYGDDLVGNSTWASGDWDGNGDFDTLDFVYAFQFGDYT